MLLESGGVTFLPGRVEVRTSVEVLRVAAFGAGLGLLPVSAGCGGGAALMHPAHTLPVNTVTLGAGVSGHFLAGSGRGDIDAAVESAPQPGQAVTPDDEPRFLQGGVAQALFSPGVAPWVGARVGLGYTTEAGATYTGRSARIDARHAFEGDDLALSVGLGASGRLVRPGSDTFTEQCTADPNGSCALYGQVETTGEVPGVDDGNVTGWGVDVPVIVGWRSRARLVQIWVGLRAGYEHLFGQYVWQAEPGLVQEGDVAARRWFGGGLLGLQVGIDPLWAGIELDVAYQSGNGTLTWDTTAGRQRFEGDVEGITVTPTGVLGARF
jgi:hypothetical protein